MGKIDQHQVRVGADPQPDMRLRAGDVVVLLGTPETIAAAEMRLLG